jgi:hypothetical protein
MPLGTICASCYYLYKYVYTDEYLAKKENEKKIKKINDNIYDAKFIYEQDIRDIIPIMKYYKEVENDIYDKYPDLNEIEKKNLIITIVRIKFE